MKRLACIAALAAVAATTAVPTFAADGADLAKQKNCLACHTVDKKVVGPSYKEVAAKYNGQKDAATMLAEKIQKGSNGTWGQIPMPPNPVTPEEAKTLATWVLTQK